MLELTVLLVLSVWGASVFVAGGPGSSTAVRIVNAYRRFTRFAQHPIHGGKLPRNLYDPTLWRDPEEPRP